MTISFLKIPSDVWVNKIFNSVDDPRDLMRAACACRAFRDFISSPQLWEEMIKKHKITGIVRTNQGAKRDLIDHVMKFQKIFESTFPKQLAILKRWSLFIQWQAELKQSVRAERLEEIVKPLSQPQRVIFDLTKSPYLKGELAAKKYRELIVLGAKPKQEHLSLAIDDGIDLVQAVLDNGVMPSPRDLYVAMHKGNVAIIQEFIQRGVEWDSALNQSYIPYASAYIGKLPIDLVDQLIKMGLTVHVEGMSGFLALKEAGENKNYEVIDFLFEKGYKTPNIIECPRDQLFKIKKVLCQTKEELIAMKNSAEKGKKKLYQRLLKRIKQELKRIEKEERHLT